MVFLRNAHERSPIFSSAVQNKTGKGTNTESRNFSLFDVFTKDPGDIKMGPLDVVRDELSEKNGRQKRIWTVADISEISDTSLKKVEILVNEWQPAEVLISTTASSGYLASEDFGC